MRIKAIIWLDSVIEKLAQKHSVERSEVEEVLANAPHIRFLELGNEKGEDVYAALGATQAGRRLIVIYIRKVDGRALILSARAMDRSERRLYGRRKKR